MTIGAMLRRDIPPADLAAVAADIDGPFEELWIVEDLPYAGGIAQMTQVLAATNFAKVGHGIAPTPFRHPVALAMEWAALATMYPGRVITGIGHGVQQWMAQIGAAVDSPLTLLEENLDCVTGLLGGREISLSGRYVDVTGVKLKFPPPIVPPVLAGVTGPRSLRLAGAKADGVILPEGWGPNDIANARLKMTQGAGSDQRHLTVFAAFYVGSPDDLGRPPGDSDKSWLAAGSHGHDVAEKLQTLIEAGADSLILMPIGPSPAYQLELAAAQVLPELTDHP
ncbi:MAG: LLM class flavin-dependent oxidoreductase [Acidimicrobiia bacterium]|nr:LLM class flavin-dependent oxidoreductase [Acidimicrobiia bacterium]